MEVEQLRKLLENALALAKDVKDEEIKNYIFSMDNSKDPGVDGYSASFDKVAWDVIKNDVIKAIMHFFSMGHLLREVNCTILA